MVPLLTPLFFGWTIPLNTTSTNDFTIHATFHALQRHNTENLKQIFPEKELRGLRPSFNIHVSVSNL
jgi:hypothetical protein